MHFRHCYVRKPGLSVLRLQRWHCKPYCHADSLKRIGMGYDQRSNVRNWALKGLNRRYSRLRRNCGYSEQNGRHGEKHGLYQRKRPFHQYRGRIHEPRSRRPQQQVDRRGLLLDQPRRSRFGRKLLLRRIPSWCQRNSRFLCQFFHWLGP